MEVLGAIAIKTAKKNSVYTIEKPAHHTNTTFQRTTLTVLQSN